MVRLRQELDAGRGSDGRDSLSPHGFAAFYERHYPDILRWLVNETRNGHVAVDLTAETFACIFEQRERFRGSSESEARGWLFAIARTELLQYRRRGKVETRALERLKLYRPPATEDEARRVEELIDAEATTTPLHDAFEDLTPQQQIVVTRHVLEERTHAEIAGESGITEAAARVCLHRALNHLATRLRSIVGEGGHND